MITIDYPTRVITIPKSYMTLVQSSPSEIRELNMISLYLDLRNLEDSETGVVFPESVSYKAEDEVSGATLVQVVKIINNYSVTFEDGLYSVNLTGANTDLADKVNRNQVSIRTNNSVGSTYSKQIQDQSFFDGRVFVDSVSGRGVAETAYPAGTFDRPVALLDNATSIIVTRGLREGIFLLGSINVPSGKDISRYNIKGNSFANSEVVLENGCVCDNINIESCKITSGYHGDTSEYIRCLLINSNNLQGNIQDCKLQGVLTLAGDTDIRDSYGTFIIAPVALNLSVNIIRFSGNLTIANVTDGTSITVGVMSGLVTIDSSCIGGEIIVVDHDYIIDNSGSNCDVTIINQHLVTQTGLAQIGAIAQAIQSITASTNSTVNLNNSALDILQKLAEADEEVTQSVYRKIESGTNNVILEKNVVKNGNNTKLMQT